MYRCTNKSTDIKCATNNNFVIQEIVDKSGVVRVKIEGDNEPTPTVPRVEGNVPFIFVGTKVSRQRCLPVSRRIRRIALAHNLRFRFKRIKAKYWSIHNLICGSR